MEVRGLMGQDLPVHASPVTLQASQGLALSAVNPAGVARAGPEKFKDESVARSNAKPAIDASAPQRAGTRMRHDESANRIIVQIMDSNNQVIKQIPPEKLLKIVARFREVTSLLFDEKA